MLNNIKRVCATSLFLALSAARHLHILGHILEALHISTRHPPAWEALPSIIWLDGIVDLKTGNIASRWGIRVAWSDSGGHTDFNPFGRWCPLRWDCQLLSLGGEAGSSRGCLRLRRCRGILLLLSKVGQVDFWQVNVRQLRQRNVELGQVDLQSLWRCRFTCSRKRHSTHNRASDSGRRRVSSESRDHNDTNCRDNTAK